MIECVRLINDMLVKATQWVAEKGRNASTSCQGLVVEDHHAALVANIRLTFRRNGSKNARTTIGQSRVNQLTHLIDYFNHAPDGGIRLKPLSR